MLVSREVGDVTPFCRAERIVGRTMCCSCQKVGDPGGVLWTKWHTKGYLSGSTQRSEGHRAYLRRDQRLHYGGERGEIHEVTSHAHTVFSGGGGQFSHRAPGQPGPCDVGNRMVFCPGFGLTRGDRSSSRRTKNCHCQSHNDVEGLGLPHRRRIPQCRARLCVNDVHSVRGATKPDWCACTRRRSCMTVNVTGPSLVTVGCA